MNPRRARLARIFAGLVVLVVVVVAGWVAVRPGPDLVQGEVEATEIQVASKIPARIQVIHVREGDRIRQGDPLVSLSSPEVEARLDQAEAAHDAASAQQDKAVNGAREEEIRQAHSMWQRAASAAELAETTAGRIKRLYRDGVVAEQRRDEAEAERKAAADAAAAARAVYDMAVNGARIEDRRSAEAQTAQAGGAVAEVRAFMDETSLAAPIDGEVSVVVAEEGELTAAGFPIVTLLDLHDVWITFNLREDRLGTLGMGTRFAARIPGLGGREIELEVTYLAAQGDYATWRATSASGGFDLKTFEVRARPIEAIDGLRPGMSAIVDWDALAAR